MKNLPLLSSPNLNLGKCRIRASFLQYSNQRRPSFHASSLLEYDSDFISLKSIIQNCVRLYKRLAEYSALSSVPAQLNRFHNLSKRFNPRRLQPNRNFRPKTQHGVSSNTCYQFSFSGPLPKPTLSTIRATISRQIDILIAYIIKFYDRITLTMLGQVLCKYNFGL